MSEKTSAKKINVFVFFGENSFAVQEKVVFWKNEFTKKYGSNGLLMADGGDTQDAESFAALLKTVMRSASLFSGPKLTVIKNIEKLSPNVTEELVSYLPRVEQDHYVVLTAGKTEKRQELFKILSELEKKGVATMEEFKTPSGAQLARWVEKRFAQRGYSIEPEITQLFLAAQGQDMIRIASEIAKLCSYALDNKITKETVCAVVSGEADARVFDLSDAILAGNAKTAFRISHILISTQKSGVKQSLIGLLAYLTKEMRGLALLRSANDAGETARTQKLLGWSPGRIWIAKKKIQKQSFDRLVRIYDMLIRFEWNLKRSSLNPRGLFDALLYKIAKHTSSVQRK